MPGRHVGRGRVHVPGLVIEEEVGLELAQELALGEATEEHRLVDLDLPVHQRADRALVRRCAARRDERGAQAHVGRARALQALQCFEQRLEGARRERLRRVLDLVLLEGVEPVALVDPLGLVGEQNGVAVEGRAARNFGAEGEGPSIYLRDPDGNLLELKGPARAA